MDDDSTKIGNLYKSILNEIYSNIPPSGGGDPEKVGHRIKGRHIMPSKPKLGMSSRKKFPKAEETPKTSYKGDSEYDIFPDEQNEPEYIDPPELKDLTQMDRDKKSEYVYLMSFLRSEIDDSVDQSKKIKSLSTNRSLMDKIIADIVLGFASTTNVKFSYIADNGDPIFVVDDKENIQVEIPFGHKTEHTDVKYLKV
jgi:hypothetical protein